ncbi:CSLREA domain-containing protein [Acinetobacter lactucae]|uniref:CSLREA domain-containing protein n=1 Tax=Acinetobacter lactucae TaxID=1785128 RepID=UPI0003DFB752|nr:CSLREA domain-containing protein [Acinetobacter lactucae]ETR93895.1 CSLREA domain protein [Acinetobacter lactucae]
MKNYQKAFGVIAVLVTMPLMAQTTIKVTTFADEEGENTNACSLREAIVAAETRKSYGGCEVPFVDIGYTIQLEGGTYYLKKELTPKIALNIIGKDPSNWDVKGLLINDYPALTALQTRINASGKSRIFNTAVYQQSLTLANIILENGEATDVGGAIYAGADVTLLDSQILNSQAPKGGAIYLGGEKANLTIERSLVQGNGITSTLGSILAMSCKFNTSYATRTLNFNSSSFIKNGSGNTVSTFELCGAIDTTFVNNTIAKNNASLNNGNVIKFTADADPSNSVSNILSANSTLKLNNNTIVENSAHTTFLYDKLGDKDLNFNIIAFNIGSYACRYLLGAAAEQKDVGITLKFNALNLSGNTEKCDLPTEVIPTGNSNIDIKNVSFSNLLEPLKEQVSESTRFLPIYYPKNNNTPTDLVDTDPKNEGGCSSLDQRQLVRTSAPTFYQPNNPNSCDIGSVELTKLTAADSNVVQGANNSNVNISIIKLLDDYQSGVDLVKSRLENPAYSFRVTDLKNSLAYYENLITQTKANLKYRGIYITLKNSYSPDYLKDNIISIVPSEDNNHIFKPFNSINYEVSTEVIGRGQTVELAEQDKNKDRLKCEWNSSLQQIILYRSDDEVSADYSDFCKYTVTLKENRNISSSGLIKASFINIAPVSGDGTITFKYLANEIIPLNLLKYANDEGDGPTNTLITKPNKAQFADLPIYLPSKTSKDGIFKVVKADREGPCPGKDSKNTCYGGNIYIQANNVFNTFNDTITYYVYDADNVISSTSGTIKLVSTATTTDDTRGGGGGSFGILSLASLLSLLAYRRYRK